VVLKEERLAWRMRDRMTEAVEGKGISVCGSIKPIEHGERLLGFLGRGGRTGCCRSQLEAKTSQTEPVEPAMEADVAYSGGIR
jgi:hypothetical protein